jgi:hypothetical protein
MDWFEQLAKAKANGREYADNGIAAGEQHPQESPLSGEWAGALTPRDVVEMACGPQTYPIAQDWAIEELCDAWEDGYNSAPWPMIVLAPGDEVEILVHGEWEGPYTVTAGVGRTPEHLVLRGQYGPFEQHNDYPHNIRRAS